MPAPLPRIALSGALAAAVLAGCQLYLPGQDRDDDNGGNGGDGTLTLRIVGSQGGGFDDVVLRAFGVELTGADGISASRDFVETDLRLFAAGDGALLLDRESVPAGEYGRIRIRALGDDQSTANSSFVDDALSGGIFPLAVPLDRADFSVDFRTNRNASRTVSLVVHTQASVIFEGQAEQFFSFRPTGYAVRTDGDRAGRVQGTLPNICTNSPRMDDLAVYVYSAEAPADGIRDIQGGSGTGEPLVSFAADAANNFVSPPLPPGQWRFAWTCRALDDNPEQANTAVRDDLRDTVTDPIEVRAGETRDLAF